MKLAALALVLVACQGNRGGATGSGSAEREYDALAGAEAGPIAVESDAGTADDAGATRPEDPDPPIDPGKVIAELGAIPAWQAVIDRAQLLGRRGQHGVVYGRIGPAILVPALPDPSGIIDAGVKPAMVASPYVWLVDDTDGNGSLGIRVSLAGKDAKPGDRVALGGAWQLDDARRWYWKLDSFQQLPAAPPSDLKDPRPTEPSHTIVQGNLLPGSRTISVSRDGDPVYFQIVGPTPANDGDGRLVADELGNTPFAMLTLPGERPSYGGQDMRGPDERWQLKKAQTYLVRIGKIRKRDGKPAIIHARTGPIRVN
ncbi:MAG: hypothetical protein ABI867_16185 [Kofleriaceae bacterium]